MKRHLPVFIMTSGLLLGTSVVAAPISTDSSQQKYQIVYTASDSSQTTPSNQNLNSKSEASSKNLNTPRRELNPSVDPKYNSPPQKHQPLPPNTQRQQLRQQYQPRDLPANQR
jgi:hypothetical protein